VSLTLVTGPANSAKARVVLDRYRSQLARGPILVVPTGTDAVHYRRELAVGGVVMGARVEPFAGLMREIAARAGLGNRPLGRGARERVVGAAIAETPLHQLAASAAGPGFLGAATQLFGELGARRIGPQRLTAALRTWARFDEDTPGDRASTIARRRAYCEEVAAIYAAYRRRLERLGRLDEEASSSACLDAIRVDPSRWGRTPVMLYGFDDLDPIQLDAITTLAREVDVVVSLPYEPGRIAFAGRAGTFETLRPDATEIVGLPPVADHYEADARRVLHHLERALYEPDAEPIDGGEVVRLLVGETSRDELELVGRELLELLDQGYRPEEIAVVMRSLAGSADLIAEVLGELGVPVSMLQSVRFRDTPVGRGLLGLLRAALTGGRAGDLLAWLRVPGLLEHGELIDRFEADLRRRGVESAEAAATAWEHFPLDSVDRLRAAGARGPGALLERTAAELERLVAAAWRRQAHVLEGEDLAQARVAGEAARRLAELGELTGLDSSLGPTPAELIAMLGGLEFEPRAAGGGVLVCEALAVRARRVRAVFVCGLQEGAFPAPGREGAFFSADDRAEIARSSGLILGPFEDAVAAERYLFYATASRAESRLRLSCHRVGDDGTPTPPSSFLDDVRDACSPGVDGWAGGEHASVSERVTQAEGGRSPGGRVGLGRLGSPAVLELLGRLRVQSPSTLESWSRCPVAWFVEGFLKVEPLEPAGEPQARGTVAHAVLARALAELCAGGPPGTASREAVGAAVKEALAGHAGGVSCNGERDRATRRRLAADIERYLVGLEGGSWEHVPAEFELAFGLPGSEYPEVGLAGGELVLRGRIDRVDIDRARGTAIVHDYKSGGDVPGQAKWDERGAMALALYMLVAGELLGVEVVGGLYQPLRGRDLRPRGALRADVEPGLSGFPADRVDAGQLAALEAGALDRALRAAGELRAGALEGRPLTCSSQGVCRYPAICRSRRIGAGA
jgi:ATP-dependent helicase/DNAse subunit B